MKSRRNTESSNTAFVTNNCGVFLFEIWFQIAEYCSYKSLGTLARTCKEWNGKNSFLYSIYTRKKIFAHFKKPPEYKYRGVNNFLHALDRPNQFFTLKYDVEGELDFCLMIGNSKGKVIKHYQDPDSIDRGFTLLSTMCNYDSDTILFVYYHQVGQFSLSKGSVVAKATLERPPAFKATGNQKGFLNDDIRFQTAVDHEKLLAIPWSSTHIVYLHDVFTGNIKGQRKNRIY